MQISNASVPFPNAVAPFSPKVDQPSLGVTKDILVSSFSPINESQSTERSQNSLSEKTVIYSPQSLVQTVPSNGAASQLSRSTIPTSEDSLNPPGEQVARESSSESEQTTPEFGNVTAQPSEEESADNATPVNGNSRVGDLTPVEGENSESSANTASVQPNSSGSLSPDERAIVGKLAARDREVRTHEQQHQSVGGQHAGAASFAYQTGPDGVQYAIGGEVSIDISAVPNNPQATIEKMRTVKNAALAPAEPSAQDRSVASTANKIMLQAQAELAAQRTEEFQTVRDEAQQRQVESAEAREEQQDKQEDRRASFSEGVRTYESLIALGQQYENGLTPEINLNEVV